MVARLAFLRQISEISPCYSLVDLKIFSWSFWSDLNLVGLKKFVWPFGFFGLFTLKKFPLKKNIYYFISFANTFAKFL